MFSSGDRVRCIDSSDMGQYMTKDKQYTVLSTDSFIRIQILSDDNTVAWFRASRFERVLPKKITREQAVEFLRKMQQEHYSQAGDVISEIAETLYGVKLNV